MKDFGSMAAGRRILRQAWRNWAFVFLSGAGLAILAALFEGHLAPDAKMVLTLGGGVCVGGGLVGMRLTKNAIELVASLSPLFEGAK